MRVCVPAGACVRVCVYARVCVRACVRARACAHRHFVLALAPPAFPARPLANSIEQHPFDCRMIKRSNRYPSHHCCLSVKRDQFRPKLRKLIGEEGEFLAYLNCVMDRVTLDAAVLKLLADADADADADGQSGATYSIFSREELGKEEIPLTPKQLKGLMQVRHIRTHPRALSSP